MNKKTKESIKWLAEKFIKIQMGENFKYVAAIASIVEIWITRRPRLSQNNYHAVARNLSLH